MIQSLPLSQIATKLHDPKIFNNISQSFQKAVHALHSINLKDFVITCSRFHFGKGPYPKEHAVCQHRHSELSIEYIVYGSVSFKDKQEEKLLQPGDCLIIPPRENHEWKALHDDLLMLGVFYSISTEKPNLIKDFFNTFKVLPENEIYAQTLASIVEIGSNKSINVLQFEQMVSLIHQWNITLLANILPEQKLARYSEFSQNKMSSSYYCDLAYDFMVNNYTYPIQLSDIQAHVGISERHLNRLFKKYYGKPINQKLIEMRLKKAYDLLQCGQVETVKEAAYTSGFSSTSYFTMMFRKHFKITPKDLHKK